MQDSSTITNKRPELDDIEIQVSSRPRTVESAVSESFPLITTADAANVANVLGEVIVPFTAATIAIEEDASSISSVQSVVLPISTVVSNTNTREFCVSLPYVPL